jgi:hypothetical protein
MTKKNIFLLFLVVLLGGVVLYLNRDRFAAEPIQIGHRSARTRGAVGRRPADAAAPSIIFLLNQPLRLTSIKVVPVAELTNALPHPVWNLVSDSNSIPVKDFVYGRNIRGMRPAVKGTAAEPLRPGVNYRLLIESGSKKAAHDFIPEP